MEQGIKNIDCMELLRDVADETIDLTITSPPYNLGVKHHTGNNVFEAYDEYVDDMPEEEYQSQQIKVLNEIYRATKQGGSIMYNHKNRIKNGKQITPADKPLYQKIELYGYYSAYDHVVMCWLFGVMNDLPDGFPYYTIDLQQILDEKAKTFMPLEDLKKLKAYPKQTNEHNALQDAIFNKRLHEFILSL